MLPADKEDLVKLESIPELREIVEMLAASFGRPEGMSFQGTNRGVFQD